MRGWQEGENALRGVKNGKDVWSGKAGQKTIGREGLKKE